METGTGTDLSIRTELFDLVLAVGERMHDLTQGHDNVPTPSQVRLLRVMAGQPPLTPTALAKRVHRDKSQVTRTLQGMEAAGMVRRIPNPDDGRSLLVEVTTDAEERLAAVAQAEATLMAQLVEGFSPSEIGALRDGLRRMLENL